MAVWKRASGRNFPTPDAPPSKPGRYVSYQMRPGLFVTQKWPRPRPTRTPAELEQQQEFKEFVKAQNAALAEDVVAAKIIAEGSKYTYRDVLARFMLGKMVVFENYGEIVAQYNLDIITETPGSFVVRGPDEWQGLAPGNNGDVLTIVGGVPAYAAPTPPPASGITAGLVAAANNQAIPAATFTTLTQWSTANGYDPSGMFNPATPTRLTVPTGYAYARASAGLTCSNDSTRWAIQALKNGSANYTGFRMSKSTGDRPGLMTGWVPVVAGDYFEVQLYWYVGGVTVNLGFITNFMLECRN